MRSRHSTEELEDISGQAGWMYTDLLLGLMVIFLATITFLPEHRAYLDSDVVSIYARELPTKLALNYSTFDMEKMKADLKEFTDKQGVTGNAIIVRMQIVGTYNPLTESTQDGVSRAMEFQRKIELADPYFLKDTAVSLRATPNADTKNVVVDYSFAVEVQVLPKDATR